MARFSASGSWNILSRAVTQQNTDKMFSSAYPKAVNIGNAVNRFRKAGINPFDPSVFHEEDFIAAKLTDRNIEPTVPGPRTTPDWPALLDFSPSLFVRTSNFNMNVSTEQTPGGGCTTIIIIIITSTIYNWRRNTPMPLQ